ncbi:hypothetical protein GEMRC1_004179 [Eukaryota sp. GEM-RC1]
MEKNLFHIEIIDCTLEDLTFKLKGVSISLVNALRRIIYSEVPTIAIELVEFTQNSSALPEEFIAHRLGLVPLLYPESTSINSFEDVFNYHTDCACAGGCPKCEFTFTLNATNDRSEVYVVRSDQLFPRAAQDTYAGLVRVADLEHPIVLFKLASKQSVSLTAIARKGKGADHAKFSPVSNATFRITPDIQLNYESLAQLSTSDREQLVSSCPRNVYELDPLTRTIRIAPGGQDRCIMCGECTELSNQYADQYEVPAPIKIQDTDPPEFTFLIESTGAKTARVILKEAVDILLTKMCFVKEMWEKQKASGITGSYH